jgi:hypothetical protein
MSSISGFFHRKSEGQQLYDDFVRNLVHFLDHDTGEPYLSFAFSTGHHVLPLGDPLVYDLIVNRWIEVGFPAPRPQSVRYALRTLEARCHRSESRRIVSHRIAGYGERLGPAVPNPCRIVLDLLNKDGEVLLIDPDGWNLGEGATHCFTRGSHMRPLPKLPAQYAVSANHVPPPRGTLAPELQKLRHLLNPATDQDYHRTLIWLLTSMRGPGPGAFPVLALQGPAASGKSTAARLLRHIVDPVATSFADAFSSRRDLIAHARRNGIVAFDNLGRLTPRLAHFINSLAGGMSVEVRAPRDPHAPAAVELQRPVLLTLQPGPAPAKNKPAEDPLASAGPSLPSRALRVNCAPLTAERNQPLTWIWTEFEALLPQLFALLCSALSVGLKNLPSTKPPRIPRLPDTAAWALACAPALGLTEEQILAALEIDPDPAPQRPPLLNAVEAHMKNKETWEGTATELLEELATDIENPRALSHHLRRHSEQLAAAGFEVTFPRKNTARLIVIRNRRISDASNQEVASLVRQPLVKAAASITCMRTQFSRISAICVTACTT